MNWGSFITCAVTGSGETAHKSDKVPVTPEQIANSCIEAAKAGAAVVHIHVRNPQTGLGSRDTELYAEVVDRVRSSDTDVVINLTAGMGGDLVLGGDEDVLPLAADYFFAVEFSQPAIAHTRLAVDSLLGVPLPAVQQAASSLLECGEHHREIAETDTGAGRGAQ